MKIPFNKPYQTGNELKYIKQIISSGMLGGDGIFTQSCSEWLEQNMFIKKTLLTHSGTLALDLLAILADIQPGDEVIMPSFTFVSTANAFVLRGAIPVFVDIRMDTLNIDETKIETAITSKTKAIVPVHYAGVACDMDVIMKIAKKHNLIVIEDAAQGLMSTYKGRHLGTIGQLGCTSFHETKNITCGQGGAVFINDDVLISRAEIIRDKGTNRSQFFRNQVDKYTWVDIGSSFLMNEITAAFLWAQLQETTSITKARLKVWDNYNDAFFTLEEKGFVKRPYIPDYCTHNAHLYYLLLPDIDVRSKLIEYLNNKGISALFHYVPLHSSPAGKRFARVSDSMENSESVADRLIRMPLWLNVNWEVCVEAVYGFFNNR